MAEKEERIKISYQSENLDVITEYTRAEVVEKMAKAICLERHACISKGEMCGLCELWRNFSTHAEAALNALLEVWVIDKIAEDTSANYYTPEKGYIGAGIRKVEIDNKYVCFVLYDRRAISCVQKEGE